LRLEEEGGGGGEGGNTTNDFTKVTYLTFTLSRWQR
jgi:hypothetical protein